jgi:hypothetical protein
MILPMLLVFLLVMYFITHRQSNVLDKQVKDMAMAFLEKNQTFDVSTMKSNAIYSIAYRLLPHVFILALLFNLPDKGFFTVLCFIYLGFQILKAALQLIVLSIIPNQSFAEKVVNGFKEAK